MPVRSLNPDDIPQVADLYWQVMRQRGGASPVALQERMHQLYFRNPWLESSVRSLVFTDNSRVAGFLGVVPRRMCLAGKPILSALGGNFAVHPNARTSLAGLHLLKTYMSAGQDLSLTDSANDVSRDLLERLGFTTITAFSLRWVRVLRPAHFLTLAASRVAPNPFTNFLSFLSRPVSAAADHFAARLSFSPLRLTESRLQAEDLDVSTLLQCLTEFRDGHSLWPVYDTDSLTWLLRFMTENRGHGEELRKVTLRDASRRIVGWYIYASAPGGMAEVVQFGAARHSVREVLDHLFHDAWNHDAVAIRGVVGRQFMPQLSEKNCFFTCRGGWMLAHSSAPSVLEALNSGDASLSRLDGEWCLALGI